jgi:hypothetical protein
MQRKYRASHMHLPESWGYLVFGSNDDDGHNTDSPPTTTAMLQPVDIDRTWPAQVAAMHVYYAQNAYREAVGRYTFDLDDLVPYMQTVYINPFTVHISHTWVKEGYRVIVADQIEGILVTVEQDRKLCVTVAEPSDDTRMQGILLWSQTGYRSFCGGMTHRMDAKLFVWSSFGKKKQYHMDWHFPVK